MSKVGTAHIEIKPVLNEDALKGLSESIAGSVDASLCITSTALIVAAVRLHEALFRQPEYLETCPDDVVVAFGDLQGALKRLGLDIL